MSKIPDTVKFSDYPNAVDAPAVSGPIWTKADVCDVVASNGAIFRILITGQDIGFIVWDVLRLVPRHSLLIATGRADTVEDAKTRALKSVTVFRAVVEKA